MNPSVALEIDSPRGRTVLNVSPEESARPLSELLERAGLPLNVRCGGRGLCNGCGVELHGGSVQKIQTGETVCAGEKPVSLLSCAHRVGTEKAHLAIPPRSFLAHQPQIVSGFKINVPSANLPLVGGRGYGVAVDVGTTTVAAVLVDLETGAVVRQASDFNQQIRHGDDVVTRISLCWNDKSMVPTLQRAILRETIAPLVCQLLSGMDGPLRCITVAGNTTMQHLLAGKDPSPLGVVPFQPAFLDRQVLTFPEEFGEVPVHLLPSAAAYIGADIVAGVLSSGLLYDEGTALLVDIGTNGEIVLKRRGGFVGCATAAGPAFEGAGLSCGMRGVAGAIERIQFRRTPWEVQWSQINGGMQPPVGICGSAYIDFLAEAREVGLLAENGRFNPIEEAEFVCDTEGRRALCLARETGTERPIIISEVDVAQLLQAKAAIAAGILTLLEREQLRPSDVQRVYLAGGFGMHLNVAHTIRCGLLPGFKPEQVEVIGNSSLAGAYLGLIDTGAMQEMERVASQIETIELNLEPTFEDHYLDQLSLD